jgi:hypothetical protein
MVQSQSGQIVWRSYLKNTHHNKGLVEWLKVKALSSISSTTKKIFFSGGKMKSFEPSLVFNQSLFKVAEDIL